MTLDGTARVAVTKMKVHSANFGPDARTGASKERKGPRAPRARSTHADWARHRTTLCSSHAHREDYEVACTAWKYRLPAAP